MAFVFRRPGSRCWYAGFPGADGRQVKKSTGLRIDDATKKKAEIFAQKMEDAARRAGQGNLTTARARAILADIAESVNGEAVIFHSVEEWLRAWLAGKGATKSRATYLSYRKAVEDFLAHLGPARAKRGIELVTVPDMQSFRDKQVQQGKAPQTANDILKKIRIPFNLARRQGLIVMNPAEAVETLPTEKAERGTFTAEQLNSLVNVAKGDWRGVILAGIYTGQRLRDITSLRWSSVDLAVGTISIVQGKTKRRVVIPLHATLATWLGARADNSPGETHVFPDLLGRGTGGAHGLSETFRLVMDKAGIKAERSRIRKAVKGTKGRDLYSLSFHSLRHTFNSILANAGIAQELRQELTGHASAAMNRIYTHHEINAFRGALETLPTFRISEESG